VAPRVKPAGGDGLLPDTAILEMKDFGDNVFTGAEPNRRLGSARERPPVPPVFAGHGQGAPSLIG